MDNEPEIFMPYRLIVEFTDGVRQYIDGLTEKQAFDAMVKESEKHGDVFYYDAVTDMNYEKGWYIGTIPPPPTLRFIEIDLT